MTISNTQVRVSYTGDNSSTQFAIPFPFYLDTDITVTLGTAEQSAGYSITGGQDANGNPQTGTVIFSTAPTTGVAVQFILDVPLTQLVNLVDGTAFPSKTLNQVNDRAIQAALRLNDILSRALTAPDGDVSPAFELPAAATRANTYLTFDSSGNPSVAQSVPSGTLSQASIGFFLNPRTSAEQAAGVTPTNYAYAPNTPQRYGVVGNGVADDTTALNRWLSVAAQGGPTFGDSALTCLVTGSVVATAVASMNIDARGMTIKWTAQTNASAEVFRINATTFVDVTIRNLIVQGGRSGTGIGNGSAPFASGIAVYGTNAVNAGAVIISQCEALNTFYAGIEIHYATNARILECTNITHNAYAGILVSDCLHTEIDGNQVFDTGNTIITDGYGITSSTSYQSPGSGFNDSVVISNNRVTNSKRKAIDAHSGISVKIFGNKAIGFGNSGLYATCEGVDKQVRDVQIFGNTVEGNTSFVASASGGAIDLGAFGSALSQQPSFAVRDNKIINLTAANGISVNNSTTVSNGNVQSVDIHSNQFENCSFADLIFTNNNTPGRIRSLNISYNSAVSCTLTTQWMNLQKYDNCNVYGNTLAGGTITSTLIGLDDTTKVGIIDDNLQDGTPTNVYRKQSFTTNVADGGSITHGMQITPTSIIAQGSVTGTIVAVTAIASGNFTVTLKTGGGAAAANQTIYWQAKCI